MKRLGVAVVGVAGVWTAFHFHESKRDDPLDLAILGTIGAVSLAAALVMVAFTRTWSSRGVGVFLTTLATGILYTAATVARMWDAATPEWLIDLSRACYLVGGPLFAFGIAVWVWQRISGTRERSADPAPPEPEDRPFRVDSEAV